jgi:trans-aconitate 2-methyltransferase
MSQLKSPGGILAVQMPNNFREPSHLCMLAALKSGAFFTEERLAEVWAKQPDVHPEGQKYYYHLLAPHARHIDMWQTEYLQPISSSTVYHPVLEWTKSTALAPILAAIPSDAERTRFQELYSALLEQAYPYFEGKHGRQVLFPFKRIFIIATK